MVVTWTYDAPSNTATASGSGATNFADLCTQLAATGKFTADATGTQILCQAKIVVGDGVTATVFSDTLKQVTFANGSVLAINEALFSVKTNSSATFGSASATVPYSTYSGCSFMDLQTGFQHYFFYSSAAYSNCPLYFYSCQLSGIYVNSFVGILSSAGGRFWNCTFTQNAFPYACSSNVDFYRVTSQFNTYGIRECAGTFNHIICQSCTNAISIYHAQSRTIKNLDVYESNTQYVCVLWAITLDSYLVNTASNYWRFNWQGTSTGRVFRQYEFDLTTEPDATVTLKNADGFTAFSVASDATTGAVATQTVTRGYYDQAHGSNLQDYGPFNLTITKAGKMPYTQTGIVLQEKTAWKIALRDQLESTASPGDVAAGKTFYSDDADAKLIGCQVVPGFFVDVASGKPVLNLNRKKVENQLVLSL